MYLPPCYDANRSTRYPVLYMIHGQASTEEQWERLGIGAAFTEGRDEMGWVRHIYEQTRRNMAERGAMGWIVAV